MADIDEFAQQVAQQFRESQQPSQEPRAGDLARFHLGLSDRAVEDIVRAVFYASMIPDEGRYPVVSLLSYRGDAVRLFSPGGDSVSSLHLPFCPPQPPTQQNIAKLAHGIGPDSHLCIVCDEGKPVLGGIHVTVLDELRQYGYSSSRIGNPLKFRIRGPGHIEASTGGIALVYKAGDITEERLLQNSDVMGALRVAVALGLGLMPDVVQALEDVFNDIAEAIVRQGHGGMLLVTTEWDQSQFSSHRRTGGNVLRRRLARYQECVAAVNVATGGPANTLSGVNAQEASPHLLLTVASETAVLEKCVNLIANLAGMDGAIVMDFACNVLAFNAIISRDAEGANLARLVDEINRTLDPAEVGRNRGSRHQSATSFARRVPNSFAFVISQDGGVTAFHNRGDGTCRWEGGLRVLD
jgi:hypothetical protein